MYFLQICGQIFLFFWAGVLGKFTLQEYYFQRSTSASYVNLNIARWRSALELWNRSLRLAGLQNYDFHDFQVSA